MKKKATKAKNASLYPNDFPTDKAMALVEAEESLNEALARKNITHDSLDDDERNWYRDRLGSIVIIALGIGEQLRIDVRKALADTAHKLEAEKKMPGRPQVGRASKRT